MSRGRKKKKQQRRRPPRQSSAAPRSGAAASPVDIPHGEMLDAFGPLEPEPQPEPASGLDQEADDPYVRDLDTSGGPDSVREAIERRRFALPFSSTRLGDEDFPFMDPGDPDDRPLLIEGEHPEFHDLLSDPAFEGEIDGVNPRLHLTIHEVVANQLWDDNPPGAWRAAKRLRDAGVERHDILHQLGEVVATQIHGVLTARGPEAPTPDWSGFDKLRPRGSSRRQAEREARRKKAR